MRPPTLSPTFANLLAEQVLGQARAASHRQAPRGEGVIRVICHVI